MGIVVDRHIRFCFGCGKSFQMKVEKRLQLDGTKKNTYVCKSCGHVNG